MGLSESDKREFKDALYEAREAAERKSEEVETLKTELTETREKWEKAQDRLISNRQQTL